jgi:hypothetical protein
MQSAASDGDIGPSEISIERISPGEIQGTGKHRRVDYQSAEREDGESDATIGKDDTASPSYFGAFSRKS